MELTAYKNYNFSVGLSVPHYFVSSWERQVTYIKPFELIISFSMITFVLAHSLNRCTFAILAFEVLVDVADVFNYVKVKTRTAKKNQNRMGMRLKRQLLSVKFWIFLAFFLYKNRLVASRHAKQTLTLFDQSTKDKNLKVKIKRNLEAKIDLQLQDAISCDCRDFCFDPQSSELQVSFRKFYNKLISFKLLQLFRWPFEPFVWATFL